MVVDDKKSTHRRVYPTFAEGYKLLECIGRGSEGSVWRSLCIPTKKEVAIKIIDLESLPSASIAEMHQQIQAMYSCSNHPHVVRYYTSFVHGTSLWSVMKYLSGGSCSDIMRLCHPFWLDEQAIKIILKDTLKALDYFHSYGRIHRDIKAGNIIISENGYVQVADFGVSGSLLVEQLRTTLCGSPCWMAPEVMLRAWPQGREQSDGYDNVVDIWSLGITALELAKGRPPFSEFAPSRVFSMVVQNPPPVLDDDRDTSATRRKFSNAFKDFVSLCLQKDPSMRPSAAKLLKHKFFRGKKSRDYLVNTVLAGLPSQSERSTMMSVNQTLPVMQPTGSSGGSGWNFDDQEDTLALLAASLESASFLGTSTTSQQSLEDHVSDDGSSCDESFFDEYFGAPTPANTFQGSSYFAEPPATPANTMKQRDFSDEEFDGFPTSHPPATPSNTLQAQDFSKQIFAAFPSDPPPTAATRTMVAQDIAKGVFAALSDPVSTATPSNTMIAQDFAKQVFAAFPTPSSGIESAPPATPSNTMIAQDFAKQVFAAFPTPSSGIESAPPATPSNTMIAQDFAKQVFAAFPSSDAPPATPANTMVAQDFAKQVFAAFPDSVPPRTPMNTLQARDFAEESFAGLPSILSPAPTPANTMQAADFEDEVFDDFPSLGESVPCSASSTPSLHNSHFLMDEDLSYHSSDSDELDF